MLKKFILSLCCASAFVTTSALAVQYQLAPQVEMNIELPSNVPTEFHNKVFFHLKATCIVSTSDLEDEIAANMKVKGAVINGISLKVGESHSWAFHNGDAIYIDAEGGATAQLTNLGANKILAHCTTTN